MERWRNWIDGAPLPVVGGLIGAGYAVLQYALPGAPSSGSLASASLQGLAFGAVMTGGVAWQRRQDQETIGFASAVDRVEVGRVLRTGVLPEDRAEDEAIRRLLGRRQEQRRRDGPIVLFFVGVFCLFTLGPGIAGGEPAWAAVGLAGAAAGTWGYRSTRRDLARYDRIEAALTARAGRG